jgi:hypothetical protein
MKAGARDWPEKTEDWHVETGLGAQSLLSGMTRFIEMSFGFAARKRRSRYDRTTFTLIGRPRLHDAEAVQ